jgi:hypothetical protein
MADLLFDNTMDYWFRWADISPNFRWLALTPDYEPDPGHAEVSQVAFYELSGGGYSRQPCNGRVRFVDTTRHRIIYTCDDPNFGVLDPGATIGYLVVAEITASDANSPLMGLYDIENYETDGSEFFPAVGSNGINYIAQTVV